MIARKFACFYKRKFAIFVSKFAYSDKH